MNDGVVAHARTIEMMPIVTQSTIARGSLNLTLRKSGQAVAAALFFSHVSCQYIRLVYQPVQEPIPLGTIYNTMRRDSRFECEIQLWYIKQLPYN